MEKDHAFFGWETYLGRMSNRLNVTALSFVSCDQIDMESLSPILELGLFLFFYFIKSKKIVFYEPNCKI